MFFFNMHLTFKGPRLKTSWKLTIIIMERLNIHGIIDLDQMARLLNEMLERLSRQESVIEVLQHRCGSCVASADSQIHFSTTTTATYHYCCYYYYQQ